MVTERGIISQRDEQFLSRSWMLRRFSMKRSNEKNLTKYRTLCTVIDDQHQLISLLYILFYEELVSPYYAVLSFIPTDTIALFYALIFNILPVILSSFDIPHSLVNIFRHLCVVFCVRSCVNVRYIHLFLVPLI